MALQPDYNLMNLFYRSLQNYQDKSALLPVRVNRCILLWYFEYLDCSMSLFDSDDRGITKLCMKIFDSATKVEELFLLNYCHLLFIEKKIQDCITYSDVYVKASAETNSIAQQRDDQEYWLFDWHPGKIASDSEGFKKGLEDSLVLWSSEMNLLRSTLEKYTLFKPYDRDAMNLSYIIPVLTMEENG